MIEESTRKETSGPPPIRNKPTEDHRLKAASGRREPRRFYV